MGTHQETWVGNLGGKQAKHLTLGQDYSKTTTTYSEPTKTLGNINVGFDLGLHDLAEVNVADIFARNPNAINSFEDRSRVTLPVRSGVPVFTYVGSVAHVIPAGVPHLDLLNFFLLQHGLVYGIPVDVRAAVAALLLELANHLLHR